jgi:hypothetical protein
MARVNRSEIRLDSPKGLRTKIVPRFGRGGGDRFGRFTEWVARAMGTPTFLAGLTVFAAAWMVFNSIGPENWRFDSAAIGFTALTLILSLQASYAAPLILLAQNRQDDRERARSSRCAWPCAISPAKTSSGRSCVPSSRSSTATARRPPPTLRAATGSADDRARRSSDRTNPGAIPSAGSRHRPRDSQTDHRA